MSDTDKTDKNELGFSEIKKWLRHRHPMIFIDRILDYKAKEYIEGLMAVSGALDCMSGHFPERAIYPGSHLIQAFAQCGIILFQLSTSPLQEDELTVIGSVSARFFKVVVPGDSVKFRVNIERMFSQSIFFSGVATVEDKKVAAFRANITRSQLSDMGNVLW